MSEKFNHTMKFNIEQEQEYKAKDVILTVFEALQEKGYNPTNQFIGYILSGDPTYITSHNSARSIIRKIERDELLEELLRFYLANNRSE
ncbi:IreB family regulatory phosphoprotein [Serpentinicella sp. ANB-PHB4]|uniref:IreB family regulatory phosphoprotein n=1 Tax=Serpentinicella sp. ANB-PHB4 TaxID=3074076 RepID=UPI00285F3F59|nr:IreB family regulatory phosphoprotein [Serpentinicella sp. ANB-PHB4]MDR5658103.1 IreB family regulatory phosphoprotein [Serpentinicella sp. ANB-PHB4]